MLFRGRFSSIAVEDGRLRDELKPLHSILAYVGVGISAYKAFLEDNTNTTLTQVHQKPRFHIISYEATVVLKHLRGSASQPGRLACITPVIIITNLCASRVRWQQLL